MKFTVDAKDLNEMRSILQSTVSKSLHDAMLWIVTADSLSATAVGDGLYARYTIPVQTEVQGSAIVGSTPLKAFEPFNDDVRIELRNGKLQVSGTMKFKLNLLMDVPIEIFDTPELDIQQPWCALPHYVRNIDYAAGEKNMSLDYMLFTGRYVISLNSVGFAYVDTQNNNDAKIAVPVRYIQRSMSGKNDVEFTLTERRAWIRDGNLDISFPTMEYRDFTQTSVILGKIGEVRCIASCQVDKETMQDTLKSMVVFAVSREDTNGSIKLTLDESGVHIETPGNEFGKGDATVSGTDFTGVPHTQGASPVMVNSMLARSRGEKVRLAWNELALEGSTTQCFYIYDDEVTHGVMAKVLGW